MGAFNNLQALQDWTLGGHDLTLGSRDDAEPTNKGSRVAIPGLGSHTCDPYNILQTMRPAVEHLADDVICLRVRRDGGSCQQEPRRDAERDMNTHNS